MQDAKEEVRARLNIEDVVGEYVELKRAGRNFKGLSPFTAERTPSFVVSPDKHIWHDFSSGKGGDVFSFVMEVEGMEFRETLEKLAQRAGVDLAQYQSQGSGELARKKKRLLEANRLAANYYQQCLIRNKAALEYVFKKRGLNKKIVQDFQIGYAPNSSDALTSYLSKKGFSKQELRDAGLLNRFGGDLFRERMMVPLMDASGQVIGFTARILRSDDANAPKYLNTPQTLLYDKSRHVFGLSQAKEAIRKNDYSVIVEGNMDVVSSHQAGVTAVVATAGTAMTEWHLRSLSRLSGNVRLAFDGDKAGIAATERAIPIAQSVGVELTIISLPGDAKDPDELIQQDVRLWEQAIDSAKPAVDWVLAQYEAREDMQTASGKRAYTTAGLSLVRTLADPVDVDHYVQVMAGVANASPESLRMKLTQLSSQSREREAPKKPVKEQREQPAADASAYEDNLLAVLAEDVPARELLAESDVTLFSTDERQRLAAFLRTHDSQLRDTPDPLQTDDTYVKIVLLKAETRYAAWSDTDRYREAARMLRQLQTEQLKKKKDQLTSTLREAEERGDDDAATALRGELNTLIKEMNNGRR